MEPAEFFTGLDLVDLGVVPTPQWRPTPGTRPSPAEVTSAICGVARKP